MSPIHYFTTYLCQHDSRFGHVQRRGDCSCKATCAHKNTPHKRGIVHHVTWHFIILILEFLVTLPKVLLYHYIHLTDSRIGSTRAKSVPTRSAAWPWCLTAHQRGDGTTFYMLKFKNRPRNASCSLGKQLANLCVHRGIGSDPVPSERHCCSPGSQGSVPSTGLSSLI